jgi:CRISPR-associated protein Csx17
LKTRHVLPGLRPTPLASYLAGLGLIRLLGEQADPSATAAWTADGLAITTSVEDIAAWLAESYVPTPVLSPWNNGSGFGPKDKEPIVRLKALREHSSPRLSGFVIAAQIAETVVSETAGSDKRTVVLEFRNRCPVELLPWIDATVVLTVGDTEFPPLLGTGGNDGRLDFSTNFHQCLLDVIDAQGSIERARDLLYGTEVQQLANIPIGQFDPAGAGGPGSSKFGAASALVNPWGYVLFVEGALLFASSTTRRNQVDSGRAAMPFTVFGSPDGFASGAVGEESRGEVWTPLWGSSFTLSEIRQLFTEARASWRGRPARRAADFYAATRTLGVARGVTGFIRYGLQQRNGLAFAAVPLDHVDVREQREVRLAAQLEDWANRAGGGDSSSAVATASRQFQRAHLEYARDGGGHRLAEMLAALTILEQAVGRSGRARENTPVRYAPPAGEFLRVLAEDNTAELRMAVGIASCRTIPGPNRPSRTMRQLLLPVDPGDKTQQNGRWRDAPVIAGYGVRPLADVLAEVLIWRCRTAIDEPGSADFRGVTTFRQGIPVPAADLHAFVNGELNGARLDLLFRACLALNWRGVQHDWPRSDAFVPVVTLGALQPLAAGLRAGSGVRRGNDLSPAGGDGEEPRLALNPGWALRLKAGRVNDVHAEAEGRLHQAGWRVVPALPSAAGGSRIAAALVPRCKNSLSVLSTLAIKTINSEEQS